MFLHRHFNAFACDNNALRVDALSQLSFLPLCYDFLTPCTKIVPPLSLYVDGETWTQAPCRVCTCRLGHIMCSVQHCPPAPCIQPLVRPGTCCPRFARRMDKFPSRLHTFSCPDSPSHPSETPTNDPNAPPAVCKTDNGIALRIGAVWRRGTYLHNYQMSPCEVIAIVFS